MSTLRGDFEQNSPIIDLDPLVGLYRPPPCSSPEPLAFGEQLGGEEQSSPTPHEKESGEKRGWKHHLCHAVSANNWCDANAIIPDEDKRDALTERINDKGRTALHVAAMFGHVTIVKQLLRSLLPKDLEIVDSEGLTPLLSVCWYAGNIQVAKDLVDKKGDILWTTETRGDLPVTVAFARGHQELGRYLYSVTPLNFLKDRRGSNLLKACFRAQCLDIALNLLQRCEELLLVPIDDEGKRMPINDIATLNTTIPSPSELVFWKRWIYKYTIIPSTTAFDDAVCVNIQREDTSHENKAKLAEPGHGLLPRFITYAFNFVGVKKLRELKLLHAQADELLRLVCNNAKKAYQKSPRCLYEALYDAAGEGNVEFVLLVSKATPEIFTVRTFFSCFIKALVNRQARVFNLIHGYRFKNAVLSAFDGNDDMPMIHKATEMAPAHILNRIYAPTLQMQRELQWFKEVQSLTPPGLRGFRDKKYMTAEESFRKNHRELMKEGEKWIKDTASSCSVVGTLIMTIMFAVAFTVPGGNDQTLGYPLFVKQPFFTVFILSTILSLLSSSTSVLMFLAILTSHYSEEKFLKSLPTKLILGLSSLFISILGMIVTFLSTIRLMLKHTNYSWGFLPIIALASVPISLFVLSQFPLLRHTYNSTYGKVFDRKVEPWP